MAVAAGGEYGPFIGGEVVEPVEGSMRDLREPATGPPLARAALARPWAGHPQRALSPPARPRGRDPGEPEGSLTFGLWASGIRVSPDGARGAAEDAVPMETGTALTIVTIAVVVAILAVALWAFVIAPLWVPHHHR